MIKKNWFVSWNNSTENIAGNGNSSKLYLFFTYQKFNRVVHMKFHYLLLLCWADSNNRPICSYQNFIWVNCGRKGSRIAQLSEHQLFKPKIPCSNPDLGIFSFSSKMETFNSFFYNFRKNTLALEVWIASRSFKKFCSFNRFCKRGIQTKSVAKFTYICMILFAYEIKGCF